MTATSLNLWGPFLIALAGALVVTPFTIWAAPKIGAMDIPRDDRRVHKKAMPRFGGLAIYFGMMLALAIFSFGNKGVPATMIGCTLIYILGLIDDLKDLRPVIKFGGQVVCAIVIYILGVRIEFITNYFGEGHMVFGDVACFVITVIWIVAITNAVNLIDGLDGLAAGTSAISALCIGYVAYIHGQYVPTGAMMAIAGGSLGFLPYNFHPAKTFMGDGGSQLLGFAIAAFSIMGTVKGATIVAVIIPTIVLGLPIFDTILAIVRRMSRHQPISTADKDHLHHRILKAGYGQRRAVMLLYCISGIMGIVAVLYSRDFIIESLGLIAVVIMLLYVLFSDTGNRNVNIKADKIPREKTEERRAEHQQEDAQKSRQESEQKSENKENKENLEEKV